MAEVSGYVLINGDRNVYHAHKAIATLHLSKLCMGT